MFRLYYELTRILNILEKTDDVIQLYEEILQHSRLRHWWRARVLDELGQIYSDLEEFKKTTPLLEETVQIYESTIESEDLGRLWSQHELAHV